ncbi:MAG: DNA polymerase III subunit gamma/tau [Pseudomonadota bacterium]
MSYLVLARKWRPKIFEELVGQEHVIRPLVNALGNGRLHHAFLFTGTRGVGKTTIARILAKSLNCETGVTAKPCGQCSACREVDEGRFIDLIEVDAASRTKVDDTRELLDNVQYAPTRGRYKVYLIDEVHMLSGHSFNALLKTLEEPPPHVKFLLATTDPQKLPVTVLSRCLQFSLKRLSREQIETQLATILKAEKIESDAASLALLSRAADGSMRDGLSLLDQAIAYGAGSLAEADVRAMLGSIDQRVIARLLAALAAQDAPGLLQAAHEALDHGGDGSTILDELLRALHQIALLQSKLPAGNDGDDLSSIAGQLSPEDVQLFYQIALVGSRDLPYAPDARIGLEMTLLRMLAFRPVEAAQEPVAVRPASPTHSSPPRPAPIPAAVRPAPASVSATVVATPPPTAADRTEALAWTDIVSQLNVSGFVRELASNLSLEKRDGDSFHLVIDPIHAQLLGKDRETSLREALTALVGREAKLSVRTAKVDSDTPAREKQRHNEERQQAAEQAIYNDPNVKNLVDQLGARVHPASIRPKS